MSSDSVWQDSMRRDGMISSDHERRGSTATPVEPHALPARSGGRPDVNSDAARPEPTIRLLVSAMWLMSIRVACILLASLGGSWLRSDAKPVGTVRWSHAFSSSQLPLRSFCARCSRRLANGPWPQCARIEFQNAPPAAGRQYGCARCDRPQLLTAHRQHVVGCPPAIGARWRLVLDFLYGWQENLWLASTDARRYLHVVMARG